jgi:arylsulfatase
MRHFGVTPRLDFGKLSAIHQFCRDVMKPARLLSWLALVLALATGAPGAERPNILFLMADQFRWDCIAANGNSIIKTPNLDRLAARGANFTHAFVQSPVCVPSRVSFFTGRYPHSHRNRVNYTPLDRSEALMQARLKAAGYVTASVGKLHLTPPTAEEAKRTGFDFVELHDGSNFLDQFSDYVKWRNERDPQKNVGYHALAKNIPAGRNPYRAAIDAKYTDTAWTGERTRHYLKELGKTGKPFFLYSSFWKPHSPFDVPAPYDAMYDGVEIPLPETVTLADIQRFPAPLQSLILRGKPVHDMDRAQLQWAWRSYYGTITQVDHEIGLILATLKETGLENNTIIVFSSDHGDQMLEHGLMGKNCFFESSVRVPFLLSLPGRIRVRQHNELVECIDLLPTLFELIGLPEPSTCQGRSLAPLITKMERAYQPREAVFSENIIPEVITEGRLDFAFEKGKGIKGIRHPDAKMVRTERWKYNYYPEGSAELYDLQNDPKEQRNLQVLAEFAAVEAGLKDRLLKWLTTADEADQIAPRWLKP